MAIGVCCLACYRPYPERSRWRRRPSGSVFFAPELICPQWCWWLTTTVLCSAATGVAAVAAPAATASATTTASVTCAATSGESKLGKREGEKGARGSRSLAWHELLSWRPQEAALATTMTTRRARDSFRPWNNRSPGSL